MNLRKILDSPGSSFRKELDCEGCGKRFTCEASLAGCWCGQVRLSEEVLAELRARYQRCLCRECLERYAGGVTPGRPEPRA